MLFYVQLSFLVVSEKIINKLKFYYLAGLTTVIGLKCTGEDGKDAELKVKSFVPEEYAHLVAQAALH